MESESCAAAEAMPILHLIDMSGIIVPQLFP